MPNRDVQARGLLVQRSHPLGPAGWKIPQRAWRRARHVIAATAYRLHWMAETWGRLWQRGCAHTRLHHADHPARCWVQAAHRFPHPQELPKFPPWACCQGPGCHRLAVTRSRSHAAVARGRSRTQLGHSKLRGLVAWAPQSARWVGQGRLVRLPRSWREASGQRRCPCRLRSTHAPRRQRCGGAPV